MLASSRSLKRLGSSGSGDVRRCVYRFSSLAGRRKPVKKRKPARCYAWVIQAQNCRTTESGEPVEQIVSDLKADVPALVDTWASLRARKGQWPLMAKQEREKAAGYATRGQLER